jgi:hypothetical protein
MLVSIATAFGQYHTRLASQSPVPIPTSEKYRSEVDLLGAVNGEVRTAAASAARHRRDAFAWRRMPWISID